MRHERAGQADHVGPVVADEGQVDLVAGHGVERPVVGGGVDAPPPLIEQIGQAGRELEAEQTKKPEDLLGYYLRSSR